ncbi:CLUMA_CG019816, isoform A [Clunio marinus]|uniref:CLUMA_CG019816, isoform A n=1 Tax=Clunio marinus TaxID=568069 RepID=A0A1J1J4P9_9DIPT|nr:CLUMA_CG019816, isoform A [Clunio marinus]
MEANTTTEGVRGERLLISYKKVNATYTIIKLSRIRVYLHSTTYTNNISINRRVPRANKHKLSLPINTLHSEKIRFLLLSTPTICSMPIDEKFTQEILCYSSKSYLLNKTNKSSLLKIHLIAHPFQFNFTSSSTPESRSIKANIFLPLIEEENRFSQNVHKLRMARTLEEEGNDV